MKDVFHQPLKSSAVIVHATIYRTTKPTSLSVLEFVLVTQGGLFLEAVLRLQIQTACTALVLRRRVLWAIFSELLRVALTNRH